MTWLRRAVLLACLLLAACGPPKELEGRPIAPADAAAARLLPAGTVVPLRDPVAREAAEVRPGPGRRVAALRFGSAAEAKAEFMARAADHARGADVIATQRVDFGSIQWLRYDRSNAAGGAVGLVWQSDRWVFLAEAPNRTALAHLIADSPVGGTGPLPAFAAGGLVGLGCLAAGFVALVAFGLWRLQRRLVVRPAAGTTALPVEGLVARLRALETTARPWRVRSGMEADVPAADLVVDWNWADAQWASLFARNGLRRTYRLRLYLDPATRQCGALDETSEVAWAAGVAAAPMLTYSRSLFRGVQLAQRERAAAWAAATSLGMPEKAFDARFDLDALKQPVIAAVTGAGWTYRPLLWPPRRAARQHTR